MDICTDFSECSSLDMRRIVGYTINELHKDNNNIVAVYADVGSRFGLKGILGGNELEVGIAEQSLIPILGGMAHEKMIPFGVAYAPFITIRAADQIRMTIGEMGLNIKLIGGSAGLVSSNLGAASMALDDIAFMRSIPNLIILSPSDVVSAYKLICLAAKIEAPVYIRLTGNELPILYKNPISFTPYKNIILLNEGKDAVVYSTGASTHMCVKAANILKEKGILISVVDILFIKPIDIDMLEAFADVKYVFTVEEHNVIGGIGSSVAEFISENTEQDLTRIGIDNEYPFPNSYESILESKGLNEKGIAKIIEKKLFAGSEE